VLSHQSHIWVVETRLALGLDRHRYLIAAPLYHMNALALAKLACAAHATIVLLPQFTARAYIDAIGRYRATWLTAVPPMIAMMLREREALARADLSSVEFVRMGSAPVSASLMEAIHRNDRGRSGRLRSASEGIAAAGNIGGLSASQGFAAADGRSHPRRRRAGNEMPGAHEWLPQPACPPFSSPASGGG
jgi:acyl-CoA synthetase (AMP-forming)/AMP-acid ligase II